MKKIKELIKSNFVFIKYLFSAGLSFGLDLLLFTIFVFFLKGHIGAHILIATICARVISSFINYLLNKNAVFKSENKNITTLVKYYLLVIIQMCISGILVTFVYNKININATIIKVPIEIILFFINFFIQKYFIFNKEKINININPKVSSLALAITTTMSLTASLSIKKHIDFTRSDTHVLLLLVVGVALYKFYIKYNNKYKNNILFNINALVFSIFMVLLYSYDKVESSYLVFGDIGFIIISIIKLISFYYLFKLAINIIYDKLCNYEITEIVKKSKIIDMFNKHPFIFSFIVILLCYIPYIIAFYPAIMGYDPSNQIREVMGMHTRYMDSVILIDPNQTITNFNPVLHTLLLGGCFKLGHSIGNDNIGLFLYSIIQITIMLSILSYSISYLKKEGVVNKILFIILGMYALVPVFPFYALSTNKDTIFCLLVLLYSIKLYDLIKHEQTIKNYITLVIIMILVTLTRNNGIYTIMLSLPFTLIWLKDKRKPIIISLVSVLAIYGCYNKVILPAFKISNTSTREMLSIPFQQTARLAKYSPESFSDKDKEVINKILDFDTLADKYNSELSDPVKNQYNIYTTKEDLIEYFKVWGKGLIKRPDIYIDATASNIYGYFYPDTSKWYIYSKYNPRLKEAGFDYHYNGLKGMRTMLTTIGNYYPYIPIIGLFVNIGFAGWIYILLTIYLIVSKKYKYIPLMFPALSFMLVNVAGPANTYFRYALPYIMSLPVVLTLMYYVLKEKEIKRKKKVKA